MLDFRRMRERMVDEQIAARNVIDPGVLRAMRTVERHRFVPEELHLQAYDDRPLPLAHGQTISQPYIVAFMTQAIAPAPGKRVLEVGLGCGYQAAVLSLLVADVYSVEIVPELGREAATLLRELGHDNVHVRIGDGTEGWPSEAPFDGIVVAAAPREVPAALLDQLAVGGRLVIPLGDQWQELVLYERLATGGLRRTPMFPVRFVPMTGAAHRGGM